MRRRQEEQHLAILGGPSSVPWEVLAVGRLAGFVLLLLLLLLLQLIAQT